ncbi:MAG: CotH kinase family protein [Bacteroidaceae bacterium]|nr:CotH kinase family protein [Bacteroidaceae bacterium]
MKKTSLLLVTLFAFSSFATSQTWYDVTDMYVVNPNIDGSATGWRVDYNKSTAQNYGYQSASYYNFDYTTYENIAISQFLEAWVQKGNSRLGDGSMYQTLMSVPSGKYRLEADAIATDQNGIYSPVEGVYLFISDGYNEGRTAVSTNNERPEHFSVEFTTSEKNILIGLRTVDAQANWVAFDNTKLYWYGTEVKATNITVSPTKKTIGYGETAQLSYSLRPTTTTFQAVEWYSNNTDIVTVDKNGVVTGVGVGTATVICKTTGGSNNLTASCTVTVERNFATADQIVVNEVQQSNVDMFIDPSFNFGDWVEIFNPSDRSVSIGGYYVSDDPDNLMKARINLLAGALPAHGYCTLWMDHYSRWAPLMLDMKLDCDGGTIYISDPEGVLLTECKYPAAISRTSYARKTDGGDEWGYTDTPTPGTANNTSSFATARLTAPIIDQNGGMLSDGTEVTAHVTIPTGATLRYTTDGSTPTLDNGMTSTDGVFNISETTVLRLRLYKEGMLSSPVTTRSFIYRDRNYTLPIVSIVTADENIFGDEYGIFVRGNGNGRPGNGQSGACNWNSDWERPVNFEYYTADGHAAFNMELGMESAGGWSRAWEPHSSNLKANKRYEGQNKMDYPFFSDRPYTRQKALKLRNGGNDYNGGRIKDAAIQQVVRTSGLYVETQGWNPVHEFINGRYIGVLNLREPNNKAYAYSVYGIDTDSVDQWKMSPDSGYVQQAGTREAWDELMTLSYSADDAGSYEKIKQLLDIEEYINYLAVEFYIGGSDWPQNNIKAFRDINGGRFRFVLFDTDGALGTGNPFTRFAGKQYYTFDQLYGVSDLYPSGHISAEIEFVTLFLNLLNNEEFRKQFIDQYCIAVGSVFEPTRTAQVTNAMKSYVSSALSLEGRSPYTADNVRDAFSSSRQSSFINYMNSYLRDNYSFNASSQTVNISSDTDGAKLYINNLPVPTGKFGGELFAPVVIKAVAPAGMKFVGWSGQGIAAEKTIFNNGSEWKYYDQGSLDNYNWKEYSYNDAGWESGNAPLGYFTSDASNNRGYQTFLDYGGNSSSKYPTYYFRKEITLSDVKDGSSYSLDWVADDGFVVYVNGTEAGRFLMSNTPNPKFSSFADTYANANPESGTMSLDASLFHEGTNVIAVEVHNNQANSSDIYWDAALVLNSESEGDVVSEEEELVLPESANVTLVARYEPLDDTDLAKTDTHPIKVNEVSAANDIYINDYQKKADWFELYNTTDEDIDIAGMYLSDKISNPKKMKVGAATDGGYSTVVPAHGYLIVWADKKESINQLHASFKLAADSGSVVITAADDSWADTLTYCLHSAQQTVGLYPDGGSVAYVFEQPTIGLPNQYSMYATFWDEPKFYDMHDGLSDIRCSDGVGTSSILNTVAATIPVYDTAGRKVGTCGRFNSLPRGVYIIQGRKVLK